MGSTRGRRTSSAALAEVQRLSQLVDSLLVLTRAEAARRMPESVDLGAVVADRSDAWFARLGA